MGIFRYNSLIPISGHVRVGAFLTLYLLFSVRSLLIAASKFIAICSVFLRFRRFRWHLEILIRSLNLEITFLDKLTITDLLAISTKCFSCYISHKSLMPLMPRRVKQFNNSLSICLRKLNLIPT